MKIVLGIVGSSNRSLVSANFAARWRSGREQRPASRWPVVRVQDHQFVVGGREAVSSGVNR
jgi:hypothetical protein